MNESNSQSDSSRAARRELQGLMDGYRNSALVYVAAELGIADLLAEGAKSSDEVASGLNAHAPSLHRILNGLVVIGVLAQDAAGRFELTEMGKELRRDAPGSLYAPAILCGRERMLAWRELGHSARTGESAFQHVFGMSNWEYRKLHPELNEAFNKGLGQRTLQATSAILAAYDFSRFHTIADVGGGQGTVLAAILNAYPSARGVLFDQPHVLGDAYAYLESQGVAARCELMGGNFFEHVTEGADLYLLKSVIHDWDDAPGLTILQNCRRAMPEHGTLLLIERILPVRAVDEPDVIFGDVHMLALTGGRERTAQEYRALLERAGFTLGRMIETGTEHRILEAMPTQG